MLIGLKKEYPKGKPTGFKKKILAGSKIHDLREDKKNRWQPGMAIQMAYVDWGKGNDHFNEGKEHLSTCISTQKAEIKWEGFDYKFFIDGRQLSYEEMDEFAVNEGFDTIVEFLAYYQKSEKYTLVHWTDKKY